MRGNAPQQQDDIAVILVLLICYGISYFHVILGVFSTAMIRMPYKIGTAGCFLHNNSIIIDYWACSILKLRCKLALGVG